ncbi:hypothetical protein [Rhizobium phage RHph_X2_28B]|uniref:hypothetical protein n=1 Tax=Rhizobium phage RHph_X2_28B TaxID=2836086 RepID=UPI002329172F|nr:hypothetical protein PP751_gp027 [Rhizobium phage RHph_X2_28B]QWY83479.1 hypothetical protein [Rhizobium phage RHph_X2_28B]QWY83715.1 hypothetical protein [Rhizobium phage RHph_X3_15]
MRRKACSTCKHWQPIIGYALGACTDIPDYKIRNEDGTINRSDCTRPYEVCYDHIMKESMYG